MNSPVNASPLNEPLLGAPWLTVIGIGEDGRTGLSASAQSALRDAQTIFGGARQLELLGEIDAGIEIIPWPAPFLNAIDLLRERRGQPTIVLASGDPMWFGVGATLARFFAKEELVIHPSPSSFSLAAARLKWPLQDVECLSLHGRPIDGLRAFLAPKARLLCLTSDGAAPTLIADLLADEGYGASRMTVLENLNGPNERILSSLAEDFEGKVADLHVLALELNPIGDTPLRSRVPGLPDDAYRHDGKITKREVRAITLAQLEPTPGALLWDIGAGSGSISIEWMRAARGAKAVALEPLASRRAFALANAAALGVPNLQIHDLVAPQGLEKLDQPDAIFIGGGLGAQNMIEECLNLLKPGGRLVANAVTLESEAVLIAAHSRHGGELKRISIARAKPVGALTGWKTFMPVTQWSFLK